MPRCRSSRTLRHTSARRATPVNLNFSVSVTAGRPNPAEASAVRMAEARDGRAKSNQTRRSAGALTASGFPGIADEPRSPELLQRFTRTRAMRRLPHAVMAAAFIRAEPAAGRQSAPGTSSHCVWTRSVHRHAETVVGARPAVDPLVTETPTNMRAQSMIGSPKQTGIIDSSPAALTPREDQSDRHDQALVVELTVGESRSASASRCASPLREIVD